MNTSLVGVDLFDFSIDNEPPRIKIEPFKLSNSPPPPSIKQEAAIPIKKTNNPITTSNEKRFHCELCNIYMNSQCVYDQHLVGKQHLKKTTIQQQQPQSLPSSTTELLHGNKQPERFSCDLCSVIATSKEQIDTHLVGKRHLSKVAEITGDNSFKKSKKAALLASSTNTNTQATTTGTLALKSDAKPVMHRCEVCNLSLTCKEQLDMHLLGRKHRSKMTKLSERSEVSSTTAPAANPSATTRAASEATNNLTKKTNEEKEMFAHLNIAWDKYKIVNQTISEPRPNNIGEDYEFYCPMCKKFMQRKLQLVDHLKSKKHHKKIYEKRMQESKPPTTVNNMSKKLINKGLNKRPIKFVNSTNAPTLAQLRAGQSFSNYGQTNNPYQQSNHIYNSFQTPYTSNIQPGQASFKSAAIQYNQYGSYKRKSPGLADNCYSNSDDHFDTKYRKNNESMPVGNTNILSNNNNISNNTSDFDPTTFNRLLNTEAVPHVSVRNNWDMPMQPGQSSIEGPLLNQPISSNEDYQKFFKLGINSSQNFVEYPSSGGIAYTESQHRANNDQNQSNLIGRYNNI